MEALSVLWSPIPATRRLRTRSGCPSLAHGGLSRPLYHQGSVLDPQAAHWATRQAPGSPTWPVGVFTATWDFSTQSLDPLLSAVSPPSAPGKAPRTLEQPPEPHGRSLDSQPDLWTLFQQPGASGSDPWIPCLAHGDLSSPGQAPVCPALTTNPRPAPRMPCLDPGALTLSSIPGRPPGDPGQPHGHPGSPLDQEAGPAPQGPAWTL